MSKLILVSTTMVDERTKDGVKQVHYTAELQSVMDRLNIVNEPLEMNYMIKAVDKKDGAVPVNEMGDVVGMFKQNENASFNIDDIEFDVEDLPPVENLRELKFQLWQIAFAEYCNSNSIFGLQWEIVE